MAGRCLVCVVIRASVVLATGAALATLVGPPIARWEVAPDPGKLAECPFS